MTWKIVADSGCDYREITDLANQTKFESVPLTIQIDHEIFWIMRILILMA